MNPIHDTDQTATRPEESSRAIQGPPRRQPRLPTRSPGLAAFLSLMPGLGQVYAGFYRRGFTYMGIVAVLLTLVSADLGPLDTLFGFSLAFFWIFNMIDASRLARLYNQALEASEECKVPDEFRLPSVGGSLVGGVILIVVGALLLLHLKFDVSLDWLQEWWPLAPIALGVYLVVKSVQARHAGSES